MLTSSTRPYTDAEMDDYSERMAAGRAYGVTVIVVQGLILGGIALVVAYAAHWLYAFFTSASMSWTFSLIAGGVVAALSMVMLWIGSTDDDWTNQPPELATDLTATAYAAWLVEDDGLDSVLVLRVEADAYLLIKQNALTPPLMEERADGTPAGMIPSNIRLVLLGEGAFRIALDAALSGIAIPLKRVLIEPTKGDPECSDETPLPDGVYTTAELPSRVKLGIGVAG